MCALLMEVEEPRAGKAGVRAPPAGDARAPRGRCSDGAGWSRSAKFLDWDSPGAKASGGKRPQSRGLPPDGVLGTGVAPGQAGRTLLAGQCLSARSHPGRWRGL